MHILVLLFLQLSSQEVVQDVVIKLPKVKFTSSKSLYQTLQNRKSTRDYKVDSVLSNQDLSDLLWATGGINRASEGKYTVALANGQLNIAIYTILKDGIYLYQPKEHQLVEVVKGDQRKLAGSQSFSHVAPLNVVFVGDFAQDRPELYAGVHAGSMSQNLYLAAADKNLATIVRAYVDKKELGKVLKLKDKQEVLLVQTVGHFN